MTVNDVVGHSTGLTHEWILDGTFCTAWDHFSRQGKFSVFSDYLDTELMALSGFASALGACVRVRTTYL